MSWYFTGDRQEAPVVEELKTQGRVRILERGLASKSKRLNFGHREDDKQGSPKSLNCCSMGFSNAMQAGMRAYELPKSCPFPETGEFGKQKQT